MARWRALLAGLTSEQRSRRLIAAQVELKVTTTQEMSKLSIVLVFKIAGTVVIWCIPLLLFPALTLEALGFPEQPSYMFVRMLGWAYLALCVGYGFGLRASLQGRRLMAPIWVGIVSNGGACLYLLYYGLAGAWSDWGAGVQFVAWGSVVATAIITAGLWLYGVRGTEPQVGQETGDLQGR